MLYGFYNWTYTEMIVIDQEIGRNLYWQNMAYICIKVMIKQDFFTWGIIKIIRFAIRTGMFNKFLKCLLSYSVNSFNPNSGRLFTFRFLFLLLCRLTRSSTESMDMVVQHYQSKGLVS